MPIFCLLVLAGCGNDPPADLMDLPLDSASLSEPEVTGGGVAIGGMRVTAHLHAVDALGGSHDFAVVLSGPCLGGVGIYSTELEEGSADLTGIGLDIKNAHHVVDRDGGRDADEDGGSSGPLTIGDLFEPYYGAGFGMHVTIGGEIYYFKNSADVSIWLGGLSAGFGINWGLAAQMRMAIAN
ncbi:MAG: hypothetical protein JXR83_01670 [Deltaproteobacteria bacterium]|nr:hypothetical protein [Deltaproteobacteria bacterium]